ncbi:Dnaaf1, partial [Symbiodinium pilosum]
MSATELDRALHASVLKREAAKEAEFREARAKHEDEVRLGFGATDMTKQELRKIIDSDRRMYYRSEELNDKLFIHYKGWKELKNLEGWTGLRALYGECNAFDRISGLSQCRNLRSLFLQENCIHRIQGLEGCPLLWNLNLSNNFIERIEGLSQLRSLNTLTIQKNKIGFAGVEDVVHLVDTTISTLDLQDNKLWDPDILPEVFARMADLRVLYLKGNPCAKKIPNYRKGITAVCQNLKYLDDRPVFPEDRRTADAFNRGGLEEERAERRRIKEEENAKHERNMKAFQEMIENVRREKRERDAMRVEDKFTDATDPVVTHDQRMQQQVEKWKEENAEDLKDDAREHAEKCLRSERSEKETRSADSDGGESPVSGEMDSKDETHPELAELESETRKEDQRKLVYE